MTEPANDTPHARMLELRRTLLEAAITHVPFEGWTDALLTRAAESAGVEGFAAKRAFPGGGAEMASAFAEYLHEAMLRELAGVDASSMKIRDRIRYAVEIRLRVSEPYKEAVRRLLAFFALPTHAHLGLKALYRTVDDIWYWAGDRSTDYNFYSKRTLLAGVYTSTLLFWFNDDSAGWEKTRAFLARRIENVMQIQKTRGAIEQTLKDWLPFKRA